jgi:hypothetical protein
MLVTLLKTRMNLRLHSTELPYLGIIFPTGEKGARSSKRNAVQTPTTLRLINYGIIKKKNRVPPIIVGVKIP